MIQAPAQAKQRGDTAKAIQQMFSTLLANNGTSSKYLLKTKPQPTLLAPIRTRFSELYSR